MSFEVWEEAKRRVQGHMPFGRDQNPSFGLGKDQNWDPVFAAFLADQISYPHVEDQASWERLSHLLEIFSEGFEIGFFSSSDAMYFPYGYTSYYPIAPSSFASLKFRPESWKSRSVEVEEGTRYFCLFNYSVAPSFYQTHFSYLLMQRYIRRIKKLQALGLVAFVVSEVGASFARRVFGLQEVGRLGSGHGERVFVG